MLVAFWLLRPDCHVCSQRAEMRSAWGSMTMLLFVKKRFADAIRDGSKTLEIRAGSRYRNLAPGDSISINGHFRKRVERVERVEGRENLIASLRGRFHSAGVSDEREGVRAIRECYPDDSGEYFVLHLR